MTEQIKQAKIGEQGKTIKVEVVKMKADLAKMLKDLEQAEEEWELMKEPEKFATMVVKQSGSGTEIWNPHLSNVMIKELEFINRMESTLMCRLTR